MAATLMQPLPTNDDAGFEVTLNRGTLFAALSHAQSIVERRNTIQILGNVLIRVSDSDVQFTATDMDIDSVETLPILGGQPGATTAPVQPLFELIRKLPEGTAVTLIAKNNQLLISAGQGRNYNVSTLPAYDFPVLSATSFAQDFTVPATTLARLLNKTKFAMSTEEMRYYLNGVYFHLQDGKLRVVATDGHRLALSETVQPEGTDGMPGVIIPKKTVLELCRLLGDYSGDVRIAVSASKIRFCIGAIVLTSKLIDGTFPDYTKVIPYNNSKLLSASTSEFSTAADRVATFAADKIRGVKMSVTPGQVRLSVGGQASLGTGVEDVTVEYTGDALDIGFNARYLLEVFGNIDGKEVTFALQDINAAVLVRDKAADDYLFVLMPMRV